MTQRYRSWRRQEELWFGWRDYLMRWKWELGCTFSLPEDIPNQSSRALFNKWFNDLQNRERMNVGAYLFACYSRRIQGSRYRHLHLHCLALGRSRNPRSSRTLRDVSPWRWRDRWREIVQERLRLMGKGQNVIGGIAEVVHVTDQLHAADYHGMQQMGWKNSKVEHESFGDEILQQTMQETNDGNRDWDCLFHETDRVIGG